MKAYDIRYFAMGHSYLVHGPFAGWQTEGFWGMAASKPETDYFHRFGTYLRESLPCSLEAYAVNYADFERLCAEGTTREDYINSPKYADMLRVLREFKPNLISVFFGANAVSKDLACAELFYDVTFSMLKENISPDTVVLCVTMDEKGAIDIAHKKKAEEYGFIHVSIKEIYEKSGYDNPYYAFHEYPEYDAAAALGGVEFRTHPGDKGHDKIAQNMFAAAIADLKAKLVAKEVILPETLAIQLPEKIQEKTAPSVEICPANAANKVIWKVDDAQICDIDDNGVLLPKNNGTVTVTVTSAYDDAITATKTVEICGQKPSFRVFYRDDSGDNVYNLPKDKKYVRDEFKPQEGYNVPKRNGYKFAGWRLDTGAEAVDSVCVDRDMTFYALWDQGDRWDFAKKENSMLTISGFNVRYEDGVMTASSAPETSVAVLGNGLFLNGSAYKSFKTELYVSHDAQNCDLELTVLARGKKYAYALPAKNAQMEQFCFDISEITETITGFSLKPSVTDCFIRVKSIAFEKE